MRGPPKNPLLTGLRLQPSPLPCQLEAAYQVGILLLQLPKELLEVLGHLAGGPVLLQLVHDGGIHLLS